MALQPATNKQVSDHAIMDYFNKQVYLANTYSFALNNTSGGTTEVPLILIRNTSVIYTQPSIFISRKNLLSLTTGDGAIVKCYLNPTVTVNGTAATGIINQRPGSPSISTATITTLPTVTANGTLVDVIAAPALQNGLSQAMQILDAGQSMLITMTTSASGALTSTIMGWYEI